MTELILETPIVEQKKRETCEVCGSPLPSKNNQFCSRECRLKSFELQKVEILCANCGKIFKVIKSRLKSRKFCNQQCRDEFNAKNRKPPKKRTRKNKKELKKVVIPKKIDPIVKKIPNHLARLKAIQQRDAELTMERQIVIMPNKEVISWEKKTLELIEKLRTSLDGGVKKMILSYGSVVITPQKNSYQECKMIVERHIFGLVQIDGQRYFSIMEIE